MPDYGPATQTAINWQQDPAYLNWLNASNLQEAEQRRGLQDQIARIRTNLATLLPQIAQSGGWARQRISGGMEDRGIFNSGEAITALTRQRILEARRVLSANQQAANQTAGLQGQIGTLAATFGTQRADRAAQASQAAQAFQAQLEQQQRQTDAERAFQSQWRNEDRTYSQGQNAQERAYQDQIRQQDRAWQEQQNQRAQQYQQDQYNKQVQYQQQRDAAAAQQYQQQQAAYNQQQAAQPQGHPTLDNSQAFLAQNPNYIPAALQHSKGQGY